MELTKSEMEIMDVLWNSGAALSRNDLLERSKDKSWKDSSVHILLNGLLSKGVLREAGLVKRAKTYGRTFLPTMTREEYFAANLCSFRNPPEPVALVRAFLNRAEPDKESLLDIKALLDEMCKDL